MIPDVVAGPPEPVTLSATASLRHLCPFVKEVDEGAVTITWTTCGSTLELHALRRYLDTFKDREISHEDLTDAIRQDLECAQGIYNLTVSTTWTTAGMGIHCSTSPTPAAQPS